MNTLEHHLRLAGEHLSDAAALTAPYGPAREALGFAMRHLGRAEGYLGCGGETLAPLPACPPFPPTGQGHVAFPCPCPCGNAVEPRPTPQPFSPTDQTMKTAITTPEHPSFSISEINRRHDLRRDLSEARDHASRFPLGFIADACHDLREVRDHPGVIAVLINAAEKQGMRLDEKHLLTDDSERINEHVVIFRGKSLALVDLILEGLVNRPPVEVVGQGRDVRDVRSDHPASLTEARPTPQPFSTTPHTP